MLTARLGGQGVVLCGTALAAQAFDLPGRFTACPRRESVVWGGSRAPRRRSLTEPPRLDEDELDSEEEDAE